MLLPHSVPPLTELSLSDLFASRHLVVPETSWCSSHCDAACWVEVAVAAGAAAWRSVRHPQTCRQAGVATAIVTTDRVEPWLPCSSNIALGVLSLRLSLSLVLPPYIALSGCRRGAGGCLPASRASTVVRRLQDVAAQRSAASVVCCGRRLRRATVRRSTSLPPQQSGATMLTACAVP